MTVTLTSVISMASPQQSQRHFQDHLSDPLRGGGISLGKWIIPTIICGKYPLFYMAYYIYIYGISPSKWIIYIYIILYTVYVVYYIYMGYYVDYKQRILSAKPGRATDQFTQALAVSQQMLHGLKNVHLVSTKNRWPSSGYFSPIYGKWCFFLDGWLFFINGWFIIYGKWSTCMWIILILMICLFKVVIFHSYVKLPDGNPYSFLEQ